MFALSVVRCETSQSNCSPKYVAEQISHKFTLHTANNDTELQKTISTFNEVINWHAHLCIVRKICFCFFFTVLQHYLEEVQLS